MTGTLPSVRTMSPKGQDLLDSMPPYYADDPSTRTVEDAVGLELQRVEDAGKNLRMGSFPKYATDTYGLLALWETMLGLPVQPSGVSIAQRQAKVLSLMRHRRSGYGMDWVMRLTTALGTAQWKYAEDPPNYGVTITLPFGSGTFTNTQVAAIARQITPANLTITIGTTPSFIVGVSLVGDNL